MPFQNTIVDWALRLYVLISLVNVMGEFFRYNQGIRKVTTPMAMPALIFYIVVHKTFSWLLIPVMIFGLIGDLLLMAPEERSEKRFRWGLLSFLSGHFIYIYFFISQLKNPFSNPATVWALAFALLLATAGLFLILRKKLGNLLVPVGLYALTLCSLGIIVILSYNSIDRATFFKALIGVLLFLVSDSILSWDRFIKEFAWSRPLAMATYLPAQFFLVQAVLTLY